MQRGRDEGAAPVPPRNRYLFQGLVADAKAFLERREMTNLPLLLRR